MKVPAPFRKAASYLARAATWIRSGYPAEAGEHGHVGLIALCGRVDRREGDRDR